MSKKVFCKKLGEELPAIPMAPYPGELGQRIVNEISHKAWMQWLQHQTMLINEKRLSLADPDTRTYLAGEMEKFLFGGDYEIPEGYIPPEK
ncbi:oxidative damage protection protein [Pleionea sp. CnH1-48]|uniref:oxidative damage protection protein n=1 Tax=Pleionea sp. CnH1-48 TaxID=2954494 RepID=UPI002097A001|nr:oxidative damage protection protein [Pleionea sp. CnH1-48]MCO7227114.1 oxidative damage protection protein [Pleionea sp. CnH1-48]